MEYLMVQFLFRKYICFSIALIFAMIMIHRLHIVDL